MYAVLCMALLIGCGAPAPALPDGTPPSAGTSTAQPAETAAPTAEGAADPRPLVAQRVRDAPAIDGQVEALWEAAEPLSVPLTWGAEGAEHAFDVELRALHDGQALYLLAQWPGERPVAVENTVYNQFTVHWRIPEPEAAHLDCNVACHTVFADGQGHVAYANAETIPQGGSETLPVAGGWQAGGSGTGTWTLEWSRPLVNGNPFDLQLENRERAYTFRIKVFARIENRPDPISEPQELVFAP